MSPRTSTRFAIVIAGLALVGVGLPREARAQFCPSYTASSPNNAHACGVDAVNGTDPTDAEWSAIFDLVSRGPAAWGSKGPTVSDIGQGCGKPEALHQVPARFPCELLKSIAMVESGWTQFCVPTEPSDQVGGASRTIIAFDCGYGVGQVTSGMHMGETPDFDRQKVASDPTYNLATGTRILAGKWIATNCVGDNQPTLIEDWYTSTWAYNGLAYSNNPNNPNYDSNRGVYDPVNDAHACPYQERVFGRIEHPTGGKWPSVALAYPDPADCGNSGAPGDLPEPHCASPTDCGNTRAVHATACQDPVGTGGAGGGVAAATTGATTTATTSSASTGSTSSGLTTVSTTGAGGGAVDPSANDLRGNCGCATIGGRARSTVAGGAALFVGLVLLGRSARRRRRC